MHKGVIQTSACTPASKAHIICASFTGFSLNFMLVDTATAIEAANTYSQSPCLHFLEYTRPYMHGSLAVFYRLPHMGIEAELGSTIYVLYMGYHSSRLSI